MWGWESGPSQSHVQGCDTSTGRREARAGGQTVGNQAQDFPTQSSALTPAVSRIPTVTVNKLREARDMPNSSTRIAPVPETCGLLSPQYNRHMSARGASVDTQDSSERGWGDPQDLKPCRAVPPKIAQAQGLIDTHAVSHYIAQLCPTLCDPMNCQAPLSMGFSRQEYHSGLPFPLHTVRTESGEADSLARRLKNSRGTIRVTSF